MTRSWGGHVLYCLNLDMFHGTIGHYSNCTGAAVELRLPRVLAPLTAVCEPETSFKLELGGPAEGALTPYVDGGVSRGENSVSNYLFCPSKVLPCLCCLGLTCGPP